MTEPDARAARMAGANVEAVQAIYAAFGRGDVQAILDRLAPDVTWTEVGRPGDYPAFGARTGHAQVLEFFHHVAATADFTDFEVASIDAAGDKVFVEGRNARVMKATGRIAESPWLHVFTFEDGKVARFVDYIDTAVVAEAYGAERAP
jgi:ketosteroid isomerase-like protein